MKFQFNVGKVSIKTAEVLGTDHINATENKSAETKFHTAPVDVQIENIGMAYEINSEEFDVIQANARENIQTIISAIETHIEPIATTFFNMDRKFEQVRREDTETVEKINEEKRILREKEFQAKLAEITARREAYREHTVSIEEAQEETDKIVL